MNANSATKPRMMPIKNLAKNGPVGVLKRCCIMRRGRTWPWIRMRPFLAQFSEPVWSGHLPSWADFITTTSGLRFSVHTGGVAPFKAKAPHRPGIPVFRVVQSLVAATLRERGRSLTVLRRVLRQGARASRRVREGRLRRDQGVTRRET
jgi:hypothetical protein